MNLLVLGWYGHNNIGDESYRITFPLAFPGNQFRFVDKIIEQDVRWCDAVILGGGNILKKAFFAEINKIKGKPITAVSVGAEYVPDKGLPLSHIYARDESTKKMCESAGYACSLIPELGILLRGDPIMGKEIVKGRFYQDDLELYEKTIVVVVNGYLVGNGPEIDARAEHRFMSFAYEFARTADETSASFVFIPFGTKRPADDRVANGIVASKCKFWQKNLVVYDRVGVKDVIDIIASADLVISSRLHSTVFAYGCGVPVIDITHHSKNMEFLKAINHPECSSSYWSFSHEQLLGKVMESLRIPKHEEMEKMRNELRGIVNGIRLR